METLYFTAVLFWTTMAGRRSFTLPTLKLTKHNKRSKSVSYVPRTLQKKSSSGPSDSGPSEQRLLEPETLRRLLEPDDVEVNEMPHLEEPTTYELEMKAAAVGWEQIRGKMLGAVVESAGMPVDQFCLSCKKALASFRCQLCGPFGFYCWECFEACHGRTNLFHVVEKWENDHFSVVDRTIDHPDVRVSHQCLSTRIIQMECVDEHGINHKIRFTCCACEPLAVTLTRANLWPATPSNPRFAFSFALLDLAEALLLECQVAVKDYCNALRFRNPFPELKGRDFYSSLIHSFEEYRFSKHQTRHMNFHDKTLDLGNICPACPQDTGKLIVAMDALFGLPRKKSAGISYQSPLYGDLVFLDQSAVDQYVMDYSRPKHLNTDCNDFLAGSWMRSASRYKSLDETAVFGYCCRHEFPGKFINLKHGEKLSYAVWLLDQIIAGSQSNDQQLYVMYDIACTLSQHLKLQKRSDILDQVTLCLPTFHSYGHKVSCQVTYGPRRCVGIGMSDGETMERLWSYLRRFSRMTKEMRASHRTDVLTSALLFYGFKTKQKLANLLLSRYKRATETMEIAEEVLKHHSNFTFDDIKRWLAEELETCNFNFLRARPAQWKTKYFQILQLYYSLKDQLARGSDNGVVFEQLSRLETHLSEWECKYSISRWLPSDSEYKELQCSLHTEKKDRLLLELWRVSQQRLFLLKLKKKYADGQKIAIKLSKQIAKETKLLKSLVQDYSACLSQEDSAAMITIEEVLDPIILEDRLRASGVRCLGTVPEKREAMDAYLILSRTKEEQAMLKEELQSFVSFHKAKKNSLLKACTEVKSLTDSLYNRGILSLLHRLLQEVMNLLQGAQDIFDSLDENNENDLYWYDSDLDDDSDNDDDCSM